MRAALPPLAMLVWLGCASTTAASEPRPDEGPLVVELFTSQGCSSCPSADALLNKLARAGELGGRKLVPLSFHVDYWDDLGWPDPYASSAWTDRQRDYARVLGDRVYTPELVVAGGAGMVGSHGTRVAQAIAAAPRQRRIPATSTWGKTSLVVDVTAPPNADVWIAIWQDGTRTRVPHGENAGETLVADRVVRRLERIAVAGESGKQTLALDPAWGTSLGAVVFAQRSDRRIVGATVLGRTP